MLANKSKKFKIDVGEALPLGFTKDKIIIARTLPLGFTKDKVIITRRNSKLQSSRSSRVSKMLLNRLKRNKRLRSLYLSRRFRR